MELSLQLLTLDDYKYLSEIHIKLSTKEPAAALNRALRRLQLVRCELHLAFFSPAQLLISKRMKIKVYFQEQYYFLMLYSHKEIKNIVS